VVAALHLLQTALAGAYRAPREVTWWLGLVLLVLLLAFSLTGSLLPWDERGYWATRVTVGLAGTAPLVGPPAQRVLVGGRDLGNLTVTRFYALHAMILPLLLLAFAAAHVLLVRVHGVTAPQATIEHPAAPTETFWPRQALYDAAFSLLLVAALWALVRSAAAPLDGPADPTQAASPRPDWYFRPIFELLKHLPGSLEALGGLALPLLAMLFLAALPFLDPRGTRRLPVLLVLMGGFLAATALGLASLGADALSPSYQLDQKAAAQRSRKAQSLARSKGVPPEGALALLQDQPDERGKRLFARICLECHRVGSSGGEKAPRLDSYLSRRWIEGALRTPDSPDYYGHTKVSGMEGYDSLGPEKLALLVDFVYSLRGEESPAQESGRRLFAQVGCAECHGLVAGDREGGPTLAGYGSNGWLLGLLRDPGTADYYDTKNGMPDFNARLGAADLDDLVAYLQSLEGAPR